MEQEPKGWTDEQLKIEEERTLSDAKLIEGGAKYQLNSQGQKILVPTDYQIEVIKDGHLVEDGKIIDEHSGKSLDLMADMSKEEDEQAREILRSKTSDFLLDIADKPLREMEDKVLSIEPNFGGPYDDNKPKWTDYDMAYLVPTAIVRSRIEQMPESEEKARLTRTIENMDSRYEAVAYNKYKDVYRFRHGTQPLSELS